MPGHRALLLLVLLWLPVAVPAADNVYLRELVEQAQQKNLAHRAEWLNLLHYKPYPFWPGWRSLVDDPAFFNAPNGKQDAAAELEATLASFFSEAQETDKVQNPQCRFIARYHWLKGELHFDSTRLLEQPCRRFYQWRAELNPHQVTLVFPAAYLNNPASMYGHTLFRIDAKDQDERTRLLAYSISYAANTGESGGLAFALKGVFGGYPGLFSMTPYYIKVREYSDIENRDVWEYELALTPEEINRLLMHVWEIGPMYFDYYFLDENCAYHLLTLLEVARPGLQLTDQFRWSAIPSDTVRAVTEQSGLVRKVVYRPSGATIIRERLGNLSPQLRHLAKELAERHIRPTDPAISHLTLGDQAKVLELGYEYATYRHNTSSMKNIETEKALREMLAARSQIRLASQLPDIPTPAARPDEGHKTSRLSIGMGKRDKEKYQELEIRPAYHDMMDADAGYTTGAQIKFLDLKLRHYTDGDGVHVESFLPLDIASISPRDDYFRPTSWKINVGWTRKRFPDGSEPLVSRLNGGAGVAMRLSDSYTHGPVAYSLLEGALDYSGQFRTDYALGVGPSVGLLADITGIWRINVYGRWLRYGLGDSHNTGVLGVEQRLSLGRQSALKITFDRRQEFNRYWNNGQIAWQVYF
jgi:hypothetical protein